MNRQQELLKLCSNRKGWTISDLGWCYQVKKGIEKYNTFDITKYMLASGVPIKIEHENCQDKPSNKKGARKPCHTQKRVFYTVDSLVKYISRHDSKYERIINKSKRR